MIKLSRTLYSLPYNELADWLIKNYPIYEIAETAAQLLKSNDDAEKITLSPTQFRKFFKIRGVSEIRFLNEGRGRKPLNEKAEEELDARNLLINEGIKEEKTYKGE